MIDLEREEAREQDRERTCKMNRRGGTREGI